jgi:DNA-binding NarL/FixJ family response regulator
MTIVADWLLDQSRELIAQVADDAPALTPRELQVARLIACGRRNAEIAQELVITTSTTERHVANILAKRNAHSRAEIAAWISSSAPV